MSRRLVTNISTSVFICAPGTEANECVSLIVFRKEKKNCTNKLITH